MLLPIPFLRTSRNISNAASSDLTETTDAEIASGYELNNNITISLDGADTDQIIQKLNGPSLKTKYITALPFIITAIGACIHITALLTYDFDDKAKLLVTGDIFWLSSAIIGITLKFSGY